MKAYWIIDPEQDHVLVYRWAESSDPAKLGSADVLTTPLIPGMRIRLRAIFSKKL